MSDNDLKIMVLADSFLGTLYLVWIVLKGPSLFMDSNVKTTIIYSRTAGQFQSNDLLDFWEV